MGTAVSVRPPVSRFLGSVSDPCFGLADSRRSPALAPATPQRLVTPLFAAFIATMPVSDFFAPFIIGLRHHAFPMRSYRLPDRTTRRPPRSRRGVYVRAWGLRRREVRLHLAIAAHPILPSTMRTASAHSEHISFGPQYPAHSRRYRRFTDTLTGIAARLAVNRGSAHPQPLAGAARPRRDTGLVLESRHHVWVVFGKRFEIRDGRGYPYRGRTVSKYGRIKLHGNQYPVTSVP